MNTKEVLIACAQRLEETGWHQGDALGPDGEMCSIAVLDTVADGNHDLYRTARQALCDHLDLATYSVSVVEWNDTPGRTKEEVVAAFRGAAEAVES